MNLVELAEVNNSRNYQLSVYQHHVIVFSFPFIVDIPNWNSKFGVLENLDRLSLIYWLSTLSYHSILC